MKTTKNMITLFPRKLKLIDDFEIYSFVYIIYCLIHFYKVVWNPAHQYLQEISLTTVHCYILGSLNYVNTAQFSGAYIRLHSYSLLMIFLFGMWIGLILYKLFIWFDTPPTSVCIIEIQNWI